MYSSNGKIYPIIRQYNIFSPQLNLLGSKDSLTLDLLSEQAHPEMANGV